MAEAPPQPDEQTGAQGRGLALGDVAQAFRELPGYGDLLPATYDTYRRMRSDPTIALARMVTMAPILGSAWSIEARDQDYDGLPTSMDQRVEFIRRIIEPMQRHTLRSCLRALDFGWAGFEKIFARDGGRWTLTKLKPLLHDITTIQTDDRGRFAGFKQHRAELPVEKCLLYTHDREGDDHYGRPRLENVRRVYSWWEQENDVACRYGRKVAGVMIVVHYPPGTSTTTRGEEDNFEVAKRLLESIAGGKGVCVPNEYAGYADDRELGSPEKRRWLIELLEDKGTRQGGFDTRLRYLDALKFRGMLRPERVALEATTGGIGTSDTGDVQDLALTDGELLQQDIVEVINWHVVDQLLAINFGEAARGSVYITPAPMRDAQMEQVFGLINEWMKSPDGREDLRLWLDFDAILDLASLPKSAETVGGPAEAGRLLPSLGVDPDDPRAEQIREMFEQLQGGTGGGGHPGRPTDTGDSGIATTEGLNGAQIRAALDILAQLTAGTIDRDQALALLLAMGVDEGKARRIID